MADDALRVAREKAAGLDPAEAAERVGARWDMASQSLAVPFFGSIATVTFPAFDVTLGGKPLPPHIAALVVHHLARSDGTKPSGTWISFGELPDASFYEAAFRGYTGSALARRFGREPSLLPRVAESVCATDLPGLGDRAWLVLALPKVPIALLWWDADDEFDARADLLFDSTAPHHLPTDGCAILGSWLTSLLTHSAEETGSQG